MAQNTAISWADDTFNPWIGCTKLSPACDGCYAENLMATRLKRVTWGPHGERQRTSEAYWAEPLKWEREQAAKVKYANDNGLPAPPARFVFCASLADVFDNAVPWEWRRDLFDLIHATPHLTWLLLTKRPGNIAALFAQAITPELRAKWSKSVGLGQSLWPRNAAIGCTVVTQAEADRDIPKLLDAKAGLHPAFAFVSMEPLLEPVDLMRWLPGGYECRAECGWRSWRSPPEERCTSCDGISSGFGEFCPACSGAEFVGICPDCDGDTVHAHPDTSCIDWVITGGETDQGKHKARPSHPDWFRAIRDQCAAAGVPYHHKQNGEWGFCPDRTALPDQVFRVGKKAAGRALDGVIHDARPQVAA
ncbi:MAG TPA: phage Gp37/Gp68 family protein [Caulobacteraceae bacterium]|nr:phage Gp37/Gp68 family protein [Caulobacteraceae bacterium]